MAIEGRINVRHEDVFTQPILLLSVDPVEVAIQVGDTPAMSGLLTWVV